MNDRTKVQIFGQTYSISSDKTQEEIERIAQYVDERMNTNAKLVGRNAVGNIAVITSLNIAERYFDGKDEIERLKAANEQLEKDTAHYINLWEDAKKNYKQLREEMDKNKKTEQKEKDKLKEFKDRCSEFENQIFDLQMENIQLKSRLEKSQKD